MTNPLENTLANDFQQKYCVIDFETEGLNLISSKPFQISWVVFQGDRILEEHDHYLFWEDLSISEEAARITRFDWVKYKSKAENPSDVYKIFEKYLNDDDLVFVGQNILGFDIYMLFLWQALCSVKKHFPVERCIDTKALAIAAQKNIAYYGEPSLIIWQYKILSIFERGLKSGQAFLLKRYGIDHDAKKLHDSLYDVKMTYKIFRKLLWEKCLDIPQRFWLGVSEEFKVAAKEASLVVEEVVEEEATEEISQGVFDFG